MDGFRTARALVLDNDPNEAAQVIQALGSLGVAVLFHTGDDLDERPMRLRGVRLLVVDMVLENRGASSDDPKNCASILVGTLRNLMEDDHHPIVVVCWTKHKDFKDEFESAFRKAFPKLQFDTPILFDKDQLRDNFDKLLEQVRIAIAKTEPFAFLLNWEQQVHDAATETSSELTRLVSDREPSNGTWAEFAYKLCSALAIAERGTRLAAEHQQVAVTSLFNALNPLLLDRLGLFDCTRTKDLAAYQEKLLAAVKAEVTSLEVSKKSLLPEKARAALNSMLHISKTEAADTVLPGNLYFASDQSAADLPLLDWNMVWKDTFFLKPEPTFHLPILLEVTPVCDFAQCKATLSRLVAGYLIKATEGKLPRSSAFIAALGPWFIKSENPFLNGEYRLVLNAHFLVAAAISKVAVWPSFYRLRLTALAHVSAVIGAHVNRTPLMKIEP